MSEKKEYKAETYRRFKPVYDEDLGKHRSQVYVSKTTGALYEVIVDYDEMSYVIRNIRRERPVYKSEDIHKQPIKRKRTLNRRIKLLLYDLGVDFRSESRENNPGFRNYMEKRHEAPLKHGKYSSKNINE